MRIHHIGYLVKHIEEALDEFQLLGYKKIDPIDKPYYEDFSRKVFISFVQQGEILVELVSPMDKTSVVYNTMKKFGNSPYHICYESKQYHQDIEYLQKRNYIILHQSEKAIALKNREVTFLFHPKIGLLEVLESN